MTFFFTIALDVRIQRFLTIIPAKRTPEIENYIPRGIKMFKTQVHSLPHAYKQKETTVRRKMID